MKFLRLLHRILYRYTFWMLLLFMLIIGPMLFADVFFVYSEDYKLDIYSSFVEGERMNCFLLFENADDIEDFSKDDIILNGFTAEISIQDKYLSLKDKHVVRFVLHDTKNTSGMRGKSITIKEGVGLLEGQPIGERLTSHDFSIHSKRLVLFFSILQILILVLAYIFTILKSKKRKEIKKLFYCVYSPISCLWLFSIISDNARYNIHNPVVYIFLSIILITYAVFIILVAKKVFGNMGYTIAILLISTYLLCVLSNVFSIYYFEYYQLFADDSLAEEFDAILRQQLPSYMSFDIFIFYSKYSIRYFFEFPPEEFYNAISLFQFFLGKIYEMVILGSVANYFIRIATKNKQKTDAAIED